MYRYLWAIVAFTLVAGAQYPGQYPGQYPPGSYPPGSYPPGHYPGGGGGIPFPRRGKKKTTTQDAENATNLQQITGMLRRVEDKAIVVTADDSRNINFKRIDSTKFLNKGQEIRASILSPGDHVMVEASQDEEGYMTAVRVNLEKEGTAADREKASAPVPMIATASGGSSSDDERPRLHRGDSSREEKTEAPPAPQPPVPSQPADDTSAKKTRVQEEAAAEPPEKADVPVVESNVPIDESDPGKPRLRRGGPARQRKPAQPVEVASNTPPPKPAPGDSAPADARPGVMRRDAPPVEPQTPKVDRRIEKTREAVSTFTGSLPSYVCTEQIARFINTSHRVSWQALDIVSAEVVYENRKEQYRNLQINGKPVKKAMEELSGAWSTGEFGTVLVDLFSPATAADFRFRRTSKAGGRDAWLFDFEVDREGSHWHVQVASQSILPAYRGSVWIDKETSQVLRIEMEAVQIPKDFPMDKIESATDYQYVRIAERQYLLPVHAEVLSCQRGTDNCSRNAIDFRNYHKYSGESTITFENK